MGQTPTTGDFVSIPHLSDPIDRLTPTARPNEPAIGYQCWTNLTFMHWRVPVESLAPLIPERLTVDTFDGSAWIGLVPFQMSKVRPWWFTSVPGISRFQETTVRTYVHFDGKDPGVWFFSLEASNSIAVQIARQRWNLNYHRAEMSLNRVGRKIHYKSRRLWPGTRGAGMEAEVQIGHSLQDIRGDFPPGQTRPGTLEHFLAERYLLYTLGANSQLLRGQVHHRSYPLQEAAVGDFRDSLIRDAGISVNGSPDHLLFSEGVEVSIYPLRPCGSGPK